MRKIADELKLSKEQLIYALNTYLNDHVFKVPVKVTDVELQQYQNTVDVKLEQAILPVEGTTNDG